jgi:hypothetical protein
MPQNNFDIFKFCYGKKTNGQSSTCNNVNYSKLVTGGNDPSMSSKMRFSQFVKTSRYKRHTNQGKPVTIFDPQPIFYYPHGQINKMSQV